MYILCRGQKSNMGEKKSKNNQNTAKFNFLFTLYVGWKVRVFNRDKQKTQFTETAKYKQLYRMAGEWRKMQESLQLLCSLHCIWQLLSYRQVPYEGEQFLHSMYKFENLGSACLIRRLLNNKILPQVVDLTLVLMEGVGLNQSTFF